MEQIPNQESATIGFEQSTIDECVFYQGRDIFGWCVNCGIFSGPFESEIYQEIKDAQT